MRKMQVILLLINSMQGDYFIYDIRFHVAMLLYACFVNCGTSCQRQCYFPGSNFCPSTITYPQYVVETTVWR